MYEAPECAAPKNASRRKSSWRLRANRLDSQLEQHPERQLASRGGLLRLAQEAVAELLLVRRRVVRSWHTHADCASSAIASRGTGAPSSPKCSR